MELISKVINSKSTRTELEICSKISKKPNSEQLLCVKVERQDGTIQLKNWCIDSIKDTFDINYPNELARYNVSVGECAIGSTPSINQIRHNYSIEVAELIIKRWLLSVSAFMTREPFNDYQLNELTMLLINQEGCVKLAEFALFFNKFKACEYGQIYGDLKPTDILSSFQKYLTERGSSISKIQRDRDRIKREEAESVTHIVKNEYNNLRQAHGGKSIWEIYQSMKQKSKEP